MLPWRVGHMKRPGGCPESLRLNHLKFLEDECWTSRVKGHRSSLSQLGARLARHPFPVRIGICPETRIPAYQAPDFIRYSRLRLIGRQSFTSSTTATTRPSISLMPPPIRNPRPRQDVGPFAEPDNKRKTSHVSRACNTCRRKYAPSARALLLSQLTPTGFALTGNRSVMVYGLSARLARTVVMRYASGCDLPTFLVLIPISSALGPRRKTRGAPLLSNT